jgi:hypothetical protein
MSKKVAHIIGNGDQSVLYKNSPGIKLTCNLPPFDIKDVFATFIVDFKMCRALAEGSVNLDSYNWIMGFRPKTYCEKVNHPFYVKNAHRIRGFYLDLPQYAGNYTNFNCGMMATHFAANKLKIDEIHLYGFDSLFDKQMRSYTDLVLNSDRSVSNNKRLFDNWAPIWENIFKEFPTTKFVLHHIHKNIKIDLPENATVKVHK